MEVRLRAAAAPRTRPARVTRATSRSRARARGTRSRTHHRPSIARPTAKHCPLQPAPRTASHTIHALTHTHHLPSGGDLRLAGEIQKDSRSYIRSHRKNNVAREKQQHNKDNNLAALLFQSKQRMTCCSNCSFRTQHGQSDPLPNRPAPFVPDSASRGAHKRGRSARMSTDHTRTTLGSASPK